MNEPLLIDTSVWIDYLRGTADKRTDLLDSQIANNYPVLICPIILQEVLQGIRIDGDYKRIKNILLSYIMLEIDPVQAAISAADLFRSLRKKGTTIRKTNDCLIAHYAIVHNVSLLHNDTDFDLIVSKTELKTIAI